MSRRIVRPGSKALKSAREQFRALLERQTREAEWQRFFSENPYVLSMSLPLRLDPRDIVSLGRPGKTEPDFVFYPQGVRPAPFYGVIELKRPDTRIFTVTRNNVAVLTSDAQTAIEQAHTFARNPGGLVPISHPESTLFLGNNAYTFVIMGMSTDLTLKVGVEIYNDMMRRVLPGNLQILRYDELLARFESRLPTRLVFLVPAQERLPFEFETVILDRFGNVRRRLREQAYQLVEELAPGVVLGMVEIPGGVFTMGSPKEERYSYDDERPRHEVTISAFHIGKYPVTQAQWRVVSGYAEVGRRLEPDPSGFKGDQLPVENVSWEEAVEFCARVSKHSGQTYRLPSEAEWEYACRAGTDTPFAFGETITPEFVNYNGEYPYGDAPNGQYREKTTPVGSLGVANRFGLYDMHGNVWEWCQDTWHDSYKGAPKDGSAWEGGDATARVLRGGSWSDVGGNCRSACRYDNQPDYRSDHFGYRVVVVPRTQ